MAKEKTNNSKNNNNNNYTHNKFNNYNIKYK